MPKYKRIVFSLEEPPGGTWYHQVLRGLQPTLQERGYALILHDASYNGTRAEPDIPYDERDMDGLIVDGHAAINGYLRQLHASGLPIVLMGRTLSNSNIPAVMPDNLGGAQLAVSHLMEHGHRRIMLVTGDPRTEDGREREQGYRLALQAAGLEIDPVLMVRGDFDDSIACASVEEALRRQVAFTAVFGADDDCALGAMRAVQQRGLTIPQDVAVVGFNDLPDAYVARPPLTTLRPRLHELGAQAARLLIDLMDGKPVKSITTLPVELIRRKSCGCL